MPLSPEEEQMGQNLLLRAQRLQGKYSQLQQNNANLMKAIERCEAQKCKKNPYQGSADRDAELFAAERRKAEQREKAREQKAPSSKNNPFDVILEIDNDMCVAQRNIDDKKQKEREAKAQGKGCGGCSIM